MHVDSFLRYWLLNGLQYTCCACASKTCGRRLLLYLQCFFFIFFSICLKAYADEGCSCLRVAIDWWFRLFHDVERAAAAWLLLVHQILHCAGTWLLPERYTYLLPDVCDHRNYPVVSLARTLLWNFVRRISWRLLAMSSSLNCRFAADYSIFEFLGEFQTVCSWWNSFKFCYVKTFSG